METIPVIVKHGGKRHNVELDPTSNGETFKFQLYSITGVEPERQKILTKGGQLKDDTELSTLGIKAGHQFMMMGTPAGGAGAIEKPKEAARFVEDMTAAEMAQTEGATPAGLQNLGNTCYMNSTLQALRAIPELQSELINYKPSQSGSGVGSLGDLSQFGLGGLGSSTDVTASLRDLYRQMGETQEGFPPLMFLNAFRTAYPQFAEKTRDGRGYAQQDAEEAWSQIITQLRTKLKPAAATGESSSGSEAKSFIDEYMSGKFEQIEECMDPQAKEVGEEPTKKADETFFKLNCHVSSKDILHLTDGIKAALTDTYSKTSPLLGREAEYKRTSRIARLPKYLPVHFVRFYWKASINKKSKILKKVVFPHELDVADYCTPELKAMLIPVRDKLRDLRKEELDVERARKRQKRMEKATEQADKELKDKGSAAETSKAGDKKSGSEDVEMKEGETFKTDAEIEAERSAQILHAKREVLALASPTLAADKGANQTGLYELRGVVTHQGASADSGHYTAYVKKEGKKDPKTGKREAEDGKWWWFNDERVTEVDAEKIETLAGGGESHSALMLLYRAVELPVIEEEEGKAAVA